MGERPEAAKRRIEVFRKRFGDAHLYLAYHAAFPLALTPDLLYRLRTNFQRDIHGENLNIPWIAVADLLLSRLCSEVGYELYEMDVAVRIELLNQLKAHPNFGPLRINDLSNFLVKYVRQQLDSHDRDIRDFAQAQYWTALAATRPNEAAQGIALTLSKLHPGDRAEFARLGSLIETFAEPSTEFTELLAYAGGMEQYARGNEEAAKVELSKVGGRGQSIGVLGVDLPIPEQLHEETSEESDQVYGSRIKFFISYDNADSTWAEWIAWQFEEAGYSVILQAWNFQSGADFTHEIDAITQKAERIIIVLSPDYLYAFSTMPGWIDGFNQDPRSESEQGIWLAVEVRECVSELEELVGPVVYLDLIGLNESEAREKLLSFVHRESTEAVVPSGFSSKFQRSVSKQPRFPGEMSILPKVLFGGPPRSGKSILPAILFGGPPHAGKSVLFYNLAKALRERGIPHYAIRACPDGEGNWFHELDQDKVRLIRVKGAWTDDFVKRICLDIERHHLPLLVDIGGRPTEKQTCLFRNCTHSLLLLRPDQEDNADFWRHLVKLNSLLPLAELYSGRSGVSSIDAAWPVIKGTLVGLERGSLVQGPLFDALVEHIVSLFPSYSPEEREKIILDMSPVQLVAILDAFLQAWAPHTRRWKPEMVPRLLTELPADTPLAVYGPGPNWLYGALAAHAGQQPFYQFDPRIGWVAPPPLQMSTNTTPEVQVELRTYEQVTVLSMRIVSDHLDYLQADHLPFPPVPTERGLILDGRIPHWLLTALVRLYTEADVAWIACHYIQLEGAVVVTSRTTDHVPGDFIALPVS